MLTPDKAHKLTGDIPKKWKKYPYKPKEISVKTTYNNHVNKTKLTLEKLQKVCF